MTQKQFNQAVNKYARAYGSTRQARKALRGMMKHKGELLRVWSIGTGYKVAIGDRVAWGDDVNEAVNALLTPVIE